MSDQHGLTVLELLVAASIVSVLIIGLGSFYLGMSRAWTASNTQVAMQRQATAVQQELTRIIHAADNIMAGTCGPVGAPASLPVHVPVGVLPETATAAAYVCFYWVASPGGFVKCLFASPSSTTCLAAGRDLFLGQPTPYSIQATAVTFTVVSNSVVDAALTMVAVNAGNTVLAGPLAVATRVGIRNN